MLGLLRRQTLQYLVKQSPFGMAIVTPEARIVEANPSFVNLLSRSTSGDDEGAARLEHLPSTHEFKKLREMLKLRFNNDSDIAPINITVSAKPDRVLRFFLSPLPSGARRHLVVYCLDASREQQLERELHRSLQMADLGKLAGGVAHDLNNHLAAVLGHSEFLLHSHQANQEARRDIELIKHSAQKASDLIRQYLATLRTKKSAVEHPER